MRWSQSKNPDLLLELSAQQEDFLTDDFFVQEMLDRDDHIHKQQVAGLPQQAQVRSSHTTNVTNSDHLYSDCASGAFSGYMQMSNILGMKAGV